MKKIITLLLLSIAIASCGGDQPSGKTDKIIATNDLTKIKAKRAELQAEISKLDAAIASLDTIQQEALVQVIPVKDTVFAHYVEVQGNIDTKENIIIYPQFSGVLTTLNVKAGDRVRKGQVLGRIDDGGLSQQVQQLETQLALAKTTYERQKRLWDQKIGSEIQYLQAKTTMESQQKAVSQIRAQLAKTVVTAPFNGVIDQIITERGQVVGPGQGLMRIVNLADMYVSASVPETYINKVEKGSSVAVSMPTLGRELTGKIRQVGNFIDPANRTFGIEVAVPNPDNVLRPNQVAKLKIVDYTNKEALVVPSNIVQQDGKGNTYVFVATDIKGKTGTAKKVIVKRGQSSGNQTEILSGLSEGDVVVTEGASALSDGMKLNF